MIRQNLDDLDNNGQIGDWCFFNDDEIIVVRFGTDKYDDIAMCRLKPRGNLPVWSWDGGKESPTLSPSILVHSRNGKPAWHGYLRKGKLEVA